MTRQHPGDPIIIGHACSRTPLMFPRQQSHAMRDTPFAEVTTHAPNLLAPLAYMAAVVVGLVVTLQVCGLLDLFLG